VFVSERFFHVQVFLITHSAVRREVTPKDWALMARFLKLFHGHVHVCASAAPGTALLKGIILAVDAGWQGPAVLNLSNTDVCDEDCARLAVYLRECPALHTLSFRGNQIGGDGVFALS